jgi:SAM-dependent methyltransferase
MSHEQQANFCRRVRAMKPEFFKDVLVLDVGSLDINGSNRFLFKNCLYIGLDLGPGQNVDFVSPVHQLGLPDATFDTIVSTECFEHDMHWDKSLQNIVRMLKPGGLLFFTCATTGRPEHGTRRTTPQDAPLLQDTEQWNEYYRNLESCDIRSAIDVDALFSSYSFEIGEQTCDLYFWGVKEGHLDRRDNYSFLLEQDSGDQDVEPLVYADAIRRFETRQRTEWSESLSRSQEELLALVDRKLDRALGERDEKLSSVFGNDITEARSQIAQLLDSTVNKLHSELEDVFARTASQLSLMDSTIDAIPSELAKGLASTESQLSLMDSSISARLEERDRMQERGYSDKIRSFETRQRTEWSESLSRSQEELLALVDRKLDRALGERDEQLSSVFGNDIAEARSQITQHLDSTVNKFHSDLEDVFARTASQLSLMDSSISERLEERDRMQERGSKELVYRVEGLSSRLTHSLKKIQAVERTVGNPYAPLNSVLADESSWSVERLLELWDEAFVEGAYRAILGRSPGTEDGEYFLSLVRNGESREDILRMIALTPEGQNQKRSIPGLAALIENYSSAAAPLGRIQNQFVSPFLKYLRSLENHIKRIEARIPNWPQAHKPFVEPPVSVLVDPQYGLRRNGKSRVGILTTPHCFFVARLIAAHLISLGFECPISTEEPANGFEDIVHIVICPQMFSRMPGLYIAFQMEQSVSSRWFSDKYFDVLRNAAFVLDYSIRNIQFLNENQIAFSHIYYLPIGYLPSYRPQALERPLETDVLFYGDANNERRQQILEKLSLRFRVRVISEVFGEKLIEAIASSRVIINIHYYEGALLETTRIYECLSLHRIIVSEKSADMEEHDNLHGLVDFVEIGDVDAMSDRIAYWLERPDAQAAHRRKIKATLEVREDRFGFFFNRFLLANDIISFEEFWRLSGRHFELDSEQVCLSLPETPLRTQAFKSQGRGAFKIVPGLRHVHSWVGCGLSYKWLASLARQEQLSKLAICEDDTTFPTDFDGRWAALTSRLARNNGEWDVFSGFMANIAAGAKILATETVGPHGELLLLDRMISMVFNLYAPTALTLIADWDPSNRDVLANTVDRYLERSAHLRVVLAFPFLIHHQDDLTSSVWGFKNSQYNLMIKESLELLSQKLEKLEKLDRIGIFGT